MIFKSIFKKASLITISLLSFLSIESCKKDSKDGTPSPIIEDTAVYFNCKINDVLFVDDSRFADYTGTGQTRIISMNDDEIIRIDFGAETTGTYLLSDGIMNVLKYVDVNGDEYKTTTGTLEITKYDKSSQKISGTFSGTIKLVNGITLKSVKEGKFNNIRITPI